MTKRPAEKPAIPPHRNPHGGGSYSKDPVTGVLTRRDQASGPLRRPGRAPAAAPDAAEPPKES